MLKSVERFLIKADNVSDYIPVASTVTNFGDIVQKCLLSQKDVKNVEKNRYYEHLQHKSFLRCFTLLVPVVGNLVVGLYDLAFHDFDDLKHMHQRIANDPNLLASASPRLKDHDLLVHQAVRKDGLALRHASKRARNDPVNLRLAALENPDAFQFASEEKQKDKAYILRLAKEAPGIVKHIHPSLREDNDFAIELLNAHIDTMHHLPKAFLADRNIGMEIVKLDGMKLFYLDSSLKKDFDIVIQAVTKNWTAIYHADESFRDDEDIMRAVHKSNVHVHELLGPKLKKNQAFLTSLKKPTTGRI